MARVAIVGVGAIGGVVAGLLQSAAHHEITLCTRRPLSDLRVATPDGEVRVHAENLLDPALAQPMDWVLIATKTYDSDGAKLWLDRLSGPHTSIAVIQNGVEHRENFGAAFAVLPVIIDVPAERRPDGSVLQRGAATMRVEQSPAGRAFTQLFAGSPAHVEVTDDFLTTAWHKLCINAAGVLSALTLKPAGVLRDEALGMVAFDLVRECVAVGRAVGAKLDDEVPAQVLAGYRAGSPESVNSLLADRLAGRRTEIDARNGVIMRLGERHGIPTPANRMAVALFKAMA